MMDDMPTPPEDPRDDDVPRQVVHGVPRLSRAHLSRPRLVEALDGDVALRVVRAPAGYGKTSLLAEWARLVRDGATLWVSVDDDCRTRLGFWGRVVALLNATGVAGGSGLEGLAVTRDVATNLPALLLHGFGTLRQPLTLVVDGFENVTDPEVEADLLRLVRHAASLYLVVGTRTATALAATETMLSLDAVVLDAHQLAFTPNEVTQLGIHVGSSLTAGQLTALHDASAGWPLAVRAGVQAPRENPWPAPGERDTVSRVQRMLIDDLAGVPGFDDLVTMSVVDGFTVEHAQLLGADVTSGPILAEVEARGLGGWEDGVAGTRFRLQPLVRQALYARLGETARRRAHQVLASWYERSGEYGHAFESALIAQDWPLARRLVTTSLHQVFAGLDRGWMRRVEVPRQVLHAQPVLALVVAVGHYARGDVGKAIRTVTAGVANVEWKRLADHRQVSVDHLWFQGILAVGFRFAGRDELVQPALRRLNGMLPRATGAPAELRYFTSVYATQAASTYLLLDRVDDAADVLADRPPPSEASGTRDWYPESLTVLAHASAGRIGLAREALAEFVDAALPRFFNAGFYAVPKHVGAAYVHLEDHRPDAADDELAQIDPHWPTVEWWPLVLHARVLQRWHAAGPAAGLRALESGMAEKRQKPLGGAMRAMLTALRAELLLAAGRPAEARQLLPARRTRTHPRLAVAKARGLLMDGDLGRALALAAAPDHQQRTTPRIRLDLRLIAASARLRSGDETAAAHAFDDAVQLAVQTGLRSPFAAMPREDFAVLVAAVAGSDELRADVDRLPVLFPEPEVLVPLTRRELVVLAELATPDSLPVIAGRLSVAVSTVKTQCRAIYRKLGVPGREAAVAESRRRGIL